MQLIIKEIKNAIRDAEEKGANDLSTFEIWMDDMPDFSIIGIESHEGGIDVQVEFDNEEEEEREEE